MAILPDKNTLAANKWTPASLATDASFDSWLSITDSFKFIKQFMAAYRAGNTSMSYVYSASTLTDAQNYLTPLKTFLTAYGYTVTDVAAVPATTTQFSITVTIPQ